MSDKVGNQNDGLFMTRLKMLLFYAPIHGHDIICTLQLLQNTCLFETSCVMLLTTAFDLESGKHTMHVNLMSCRVVD